MSDRWNQIAAQVRSRLRRLVLLRGLSWTFVAFVGLTWLVGIADFGLHLDATTTRLLLTSGIVGASLIVLWQEVVRPLLISLSDVDVARLIERSQRAFDDRLASAAQFRESHEDVSLGSPDLQRAVVARADEVVDRVDVDRVFSNRPVRHAILAGAMVGLVALVTVLATPQTAQTALRRLAMPFADVPWPRTTDLRLLSSELTPLSDEALRTTAGESLAVYVENRLGELPDDLTLELVFPDDVQQKQTLRSTLLRDTAGESHEVGIVTLLAYRGPLRFRVSGGDDEGTDWRTLDVVPAPTLTSMQIKLQPPSYTHLPESTQAGPGLIEGLVGTHVRLEADVNKPLASAVLHREGLADQQIALSNERQHLVAEFVIEEPGSSWYWIELTDEHGLQEPEPPRYELRGIPDRPPVVYLDEPATDMSVTPDAVVPLRIIAQDDLGLTGLRLRYTDQVVHEEAPNAAMTALELSTSLPTEETNETDWQLKPLALSPGTRLTYWVEAVDACDVGLESDESAGQIGTSAQRYLDVISTEDKQRELAARQSGLLDTLEAIRDRETQAHDVTSELRIQADVTRQLRPEDVELLKQAELQQRDIRRLVADEASGLLKEVETIQQELAQNHIEDSESSQRLAVLAEELSDLDSRWLPSIEQSLARARKSIETDSADSADPNQTPAGEEAAADLRNAEEAQASALAVLVDAAELLGGWKQRFRLSSELDAIVSDQRGVKEATRDVGQETLGKSASRLSDQQQADLARLADRQRRLAARLDELLKPTEGSSEQVPGESGATDHTADELLSEAREWLTEQDTASQMHQAAESLKRNEIPSAIEAQESVIAALRDFGQRLNESEMTDPDELLSRLGKQQEQVETLRKEQETLARTSQQSLSPTADPARGDQLQRLRKQQSELADEAVKLSRELKRQQSGDASRTAGRAARRMREAQDALDKQQPREVAENQQEALDDLDQLANELAAQQREMEQEQARQQLRELADALRGLADRQTVLREETADLHGRQAERGTWSRSLRRDLNTLKEKQTDLEKNVSIHREQVAELDVVRTVLKSVEELMRESMMLLENQETGESTTQVQQSAVDRLLAVVEVLAPDEEQQSDAGPSGPPAGQPTSEPQSQNRHIAMQLRLLRHMQADINRRTELLGEQAAQDGEGQSSEAQAALAQEQSQVAELSRALLQQFLQSQTPDIQPMLEHEETPE
ncbi:MAG: hypothetical protein R3C02_19370 [Planctomycetaceae bacterium]